MLKLINTKILLSGAVLLVAAALVIGATFAFFSDTETSTGNTFVAGAIDLKVDSQCHRYEFVGDVRGANSEGYIEVDCDGEGDQYGDWTEADLGVHKFFNFTDLKPGDRGEDTISLHVYTNDAWGKLVVTPTSDLDVDCTEPEKESSDLECNPSGNPGDGELQEALNFSVWLDQGSTPGFQCNDPDNSETTGAACAVDTNEGDNIRQEQTEPLLISLGPINDPSETWNIWEGLAAVYGPAGCTVADGHTDYGVCNGIAQDGRMVGSTTYYFGVEWDLPFATGNEAQGDTFVGDMSIQAVQHRNNPSQQF